MIDVTPENGTKAGEGRMSQVHASRPAAPVPVEAPGESLDGPHLPEPPPIPAEPPLIFEDPQFEFTDGPCPPGYVRVSVDAVDEAGHFTAGLSYCERRRSNPSEQPHEAGPRSDHHRPLEP